MKVIRDINNNLEVKFNVRAVQENNERGKCISIDEIEWNESLYSQEENQIIQDYIWDNGGWEDILDEIQSTNNY